MNIMTTILHYLFSVLLKVPINAIHHAANTLFHLTLHSAFFNPLALELDIYIVAHNLGKM